MRTLSPNFRAGEASTLPRQGLKSLAMLLTANAAAQAAALLASPVLARIYGPREFGDIAMLTSVVLLLGVGGLRYEAAIPLQKGERRSLTITLLALLLALLVPGILLLGLLLLVLVRTVWGIPDIIPLWAVYAPASILGANVFLIFTQVAQREGMFKELARARLYQTFSSLGAQLGLGGIGLASIGLMVGQVTSYLTGCGNLVRYLQIRAARIRHAFTRRRLLWALNRYRNFPKYSVTSSILINATMQSTPVLISAIYGPVAAGMYFFANRILSTPFQVVGMTVFHQYNSDLSQIIRENPEKINNLLLKTIKRLLLLGVAPIIIVGIFAPDLFSVIFGNKWRHSGVIARSMMPMYIMQMLSSPISGTMSILELQRIDLILSIVRIAFISCVFIAAKTMQLSEMTAVSIYSWSMSVMYLVYLAAYFSSINLKFRA